MPMIANNRMGHLNLGVEKYSAGAYLASVTFVDNYNFGEVLKRPPK